MFSQMKIPKLYKTAASKNKEQLKNGSSKILRDMTFIFK